MAGHSEHTTKPHMPRQFTRTDAERSASFVYSTSVGKTGLYIPADYIPDKRNSVIFDEDSDENVEELAPPLAFDEESSLLNLEDSSILQTEYSGHGYDTLSTHTRQRRGSLSKSLVDQERELLTDNKLLSPEASPCPVDLLPSELTDEVDEESRDVVHAWECALQSGKDIHTSYKRETLTLTTNAFPLVLTFVLQYSLSLASIFSVSHLGTKQLGGVTLGSMTANITGFAAIQGFCTCLDTLCSQAYGAKNNHLVGVLIQRCAAISILFYLPMIYIWWFWSETLLCMFIPEPELCVLAANYLKVIAFGMPGFILFECGKRFLQCQGIFHASTLVLLVCAPLNALMNYVLVWNSKIGIGYLGAPISVAINYWLMALGLLIYTKTTNHEANPMKCWNGIIKPHQLFKNYKVMFNLALPGIMMVEAEFLGFEILTIFSSHLGETALGAQSIVSTVAALAYQIPFSISISTSTRVANFIGASLYEACIITCKVSLLLSFACSSLNMFIIFRFKEQIARLLSSEPAVINLVISTLPVLAFMQLFDAFNASTAGCLRGQGRQKIGGYINIFAFYCIGIPMSYLFTFHLDFGVAGLWMGITCALMTMSICQGYSVFHVNWNDIIAASKSRNSETDTTRV